MKKIIVILLVLVLSLSFASCKAEKVNGNKTADVPKATQPVENTKAPTPATLPIPESSINEKAIELAREGKVTGLNIGIGSTLQETIAQLGEPTALDNFEGASYVSYELVDFMLDRIIEDTKAEANISGIILSEGYELYGVKVGMTPADIKSVLGTPSSEGLDSDSETDTWRIDYDCGDYMLSFFSNDKASATVSAYLSKKQ